MIRKLGWLVCLYLLIPGRLAAAETPGITYTNDRVARVPWSIHIVKADRAGGLFELQSVHAQGAAVGLARLSDQIRLADSAAGTPVAAINGDFYQRERALAGDPRGLQIVNGELISAPVGAPCFWITAFGAPRATNVNSLFELVWPNGQKTEFGLNSERQAGGVVLYTAAVGTSTHTSGGREIVLERAGEKPWLPLKVGEQYEARVREVRNKGDSEVEPTTLVLSIGPVALRTAPAVKAGDIVKISTATMPNLWGCKSAIGGGPVLVHAGVAQKTPKADSEAYQFKSMSERHPRSAVGWNSQNFFLIEVDGRQKFSVGMTLDELGVYMRKLGCDEAISLDGGGSATLWYHGKVQNSPCDGHERDIANALVLVKKKAPRNSPAPQ